MFLVILDVMDPNQDSGSDEDCSPELAAAISSAVSKFSTQGVTDKWDPELASALDHAVQEMVDDGIIPNWEYFRTLVSSKWENGVCLGLQNLTVKDTPDQTSIPTDDDSHLGAVGGVDVTSVVNPSTGRSYFPSAEGFYPKVVNSPAKEPEYLSKILE